MHPAPTLTSSQRRLLELSRRRGAGVVVAAITAGSLTMSLTITGLSLLFGSPSRSMVITSFVVATIVPLIVAPLASSMVVRLLQVVADAHDELHILATTTDYLTGVANRRRFFEEAAEMLANRPPDHAVLAAMVDIDDFKQVNDAYGHASGDAALRLVATRLRTAISSHGVVGRLGGDEFGVFVAVPHPDETRVSEAVHAACAQIDLAPSRVIAASVGLRRVDDAPGVDEAMRLADNALYAAKAELLGATFASPFE